MPVPEMKEKLNSQIKQVETDVDGLDKRLHYLETTAKNSQVSHEHAPVLVVRFRTWRLTTYQDHIEAMLRRGGAS